MTVESYWRTRANAVIGPLLLQAMAEGWSEKRLSEALNYAYPFGPKRYHPYQVWLSCRKEALQKLRLATQVPTPAGKALTDLPLFAGLVEGTPG